ncbi:hypothetical protein [Sporolactobacillus terrae]|uniref:hypothetical protein n=1 Tax=Sporolactobacillus terrae TaxID=269673 RepID=UPI00048F4395|nr:hypothetical protein [Sporolactobacillus terrae]UAK16747.1 hypothetical protein K7399_01905 [Sporolactobacillus terrae]
MITIVKKRIKKLINPTMDEDLVELAGYHAYHLYNNNSVYVNGRKYRVINIVDSKEDNYGLNAMTVQNIGTGEFTVVFVGTDKKQPMDLITDIQLLNSAEPEQLKAARTYFDRLNEKYGENLCAAIPWAARLQMQ